MNGNVENLTTEVERLFSGLIGAEYDWIVHLFSDESPDHIMRLEPSLACMKEIGFDPIVVRFRERIITLLVAEKTKM